MNKKAIIISIITSIIIIASLLGILKFSFSEESTMGIDVEYSKAVLPSKGKLADGELDPNTYPYHTHTGSFEALKHTSGGEVMLDGFEIYCINPGSPVSYAYEIRYAAAQALVGTYTSSSHTYSNGHAPDPDHIGDRTPPYYVEDRTDELPPAAAYIVSDEPVDQWSLDKQRAIWNLRDESLYNPEDDDDPNNDHYEPADDDIIIGDGDSSTSGPSIYDQEAKDYGEYDNKVRKRGIKAKDKTNLDDVRIKVNQDTGKYTVGPYEVSYVNSIYGNIAFGGISNMTVLGYNEDGQLVRDDIKVEKFILKDTTTGTMGSAVTPEYFEPDHLKVDETPQVYPLPNQEFQIVFSDPNKGLASDDNNRVAYIKLKVNFKYMLANGQYTRLKGTKYTVKYTETHPDGSHTGHYHYDSDGDRCSGHFCYYTCRKTIYLEGAQQQWHMAVDAIRSIFEEELIVGGPDVPPPPDTPKLQMDLGGIVWDDAVATKETKADGVSNTADNLDRRMKNVKVTLYEQDGTIATLLSNEDEQGISDEELMHRINPTYTDENGEYLFRGLDPMKKYYVVFEYNGQRYLPTEYLNTAGGQYNSVAQMVNAGLYNTSEWEVSSKGTESESANFAGIEISRKDYDERFSEITAYPENYPSSNSLGHAINGYNATFTQRDLMGYTLDAGEGDKYTQTKIQLVDGYEFDENGNETTTFKEGEISKRVREYIKANKKFPDDNAMKNIYNDIAGQDEELWQKLQFIEDATIQAYSGSPFNQEKDLYPVYNQFYINGNDEDQNGSVDFDTQELIFDGVTYKPIYPGQYFVNLGLWRRQEYDAAVRKDMFKAAIKINGKTMTYDYEERKESNEESSNNGDGKDNDTLWDIVVRMSDYDNYYGVGYDRNIYETDYIFGQDLAAEHPGDPLEVYATYKIAVTNQSMSIETQIKEIVDYYDAEYTFKPNLSWVTFQYYRNTNKDITEKYYNMMDQPQTDIDDNSNNLALKYMAYDENDKLIAVTEETANRPSTNKNLGSGYKNLYIKPIKDIKLETGETAYIYLTFQVNKDSSGKIIVDSEDSPKRNLVEINGYATYYRDGTELPNGVTKGSNDVAGLIDRDSNPGNLDADDLQGDKYERNFEDDTDEAPPLNITIDTEDVRQVNGTVWEDERTEDVDGSRVGNGMRDEDEEDVAGVTVELVEKCTNGTEWVWGTTTTDENGNYKIESFIPGDYIVRFKYGDTDQTALSTTSKGAQGANIVSYNGQDFKSTSYQNGVDQTGYTELDHRYIGYENTKTQNETAKYNADAIGSGYNSEDIDTFGYDIYKMDELTDQGNNYSDAKDIWSRRADVINYSNANVTNHKAEVLASPYQVPSYNGTDYSDDQMKALYEELKENTQMTAETGMIVMEVEYNRQTTSGDDETKNNEDTSDHDYYKGENNKNGNYVISNLDFGLVERPKAQLEIDKSVANIRVTLANNNILFDINKEANNALWQDHKEYNVDEGKKDGMYPAYYNVENKHRYSYREEIDEIVKGTDKGLIQLTMDEEIMHGATIQITYAVKITNVGEVDYIDGDNKNFYYLNSTEGTHESTTTANQVIDYVQNNLKFDATAQNNAPNAKNGESEDKVKTNTENGWAVIKVDDIMSQNLVNEQLKEDITNTFIDVIQTKAFEDENSKNLKPGEDVTKMLILSQEITSENAATDLAYSNMVEIVMTSNDAGRRMAYSVVGNQDPTLTDASEIDANVAERVVILPPFGEQRIYYLLGITIGAILIGGIVLIRRKVIKGKNNNKEK